MVEEEEEGEVEGEEGESRELRYSQVQSGLGGEEQDCSGERRRSLRRSMAG